MIVQDNLQKIEQEIADINLRLMNVRRSAGGGETNTASNQGVGGVGVYDAKVGVDLQFRNINAASAKITVVHDAPNKEIDIDVDPSQIFINDLGDVNTAGKANNDIIFWNAGAAQWQVKAEAGGAGDVTAAANLANDYVVRGDGGAKGIQDSILYLTDVGLLGLNDTSCAQVTIGFIINQGANTDNLMAFKGSHTNHGLSGYETDTYGHIGPSEATNGGLRIMGLSSHNFGTIRLSGLTSSVSTGKTENNQAVVMVNSYYWTGAGIQNAPANMNLFGVRTKRSTGYDTVFLVDEDGDIWMQGNLGINEASPDGQIHITSTGDVLVVLEADSDNSGETDNPRLEMRQDGAIVIAAIGIEGPAGTLYTGTEENAMYIMQEYDSPLQFGQNSVVAMTINTDGDLVLVNDLIMTDGATIGQVGAGILLAFDFTNDYLEITECKVSIGSTVPLGKFDIRGEDAFSVVYNTYNDDLYLSKITSGVGTFGASIGFAGGHTSRHCAIVAVQETADANQAGLAFFVHASTSQADDMVERMRLSYKGSVYINETSNSFMHQGLTIQQGAYDNELLAGKSSDIAHGVTGAAETDTYYYIQKISGANGGAYVMGITEDEIAQEIAGICTNQDNDKTNSENAIISLRGFTKSGTGVTTPSAQTNLVVIKAHATSVIIFDREGDMYYDGALNNFDKFDDIVACRDAAQILSGQFENFLIYNEKAFVEMGILGAPIKQGGLVSHKNLTALQLGAIGQIYDSLEELKEKINRLEAN